MAFLLFLFAIIIGVATFVEAHYGTATAQAYIYKTRWFEFIMLLLILNFAGNIRRYQLITSKKFPTLLLHIALIIIFIGAAITRYYSFEGKLQVEEGKSENIILSYKTFFKYMVKAQNKAPYYGESPFILSPYHANFNKTITYDNKKVEFKVIDYIQKKNSSGHPAIEIVTKLGGQSGISAGEKSSRILLKGDTIHFDGHVLGFESKKLSLMNITEKNNHLYIQAPYEFSFFNMMKNESGEVKARQSVKLERILYSVGKARFVPLTDALDNLIIGELKSGNETRKVSFFGQQFTTNFSPIYKINGLEVSLGFGSSWLDRKYKMPFNLHLNDFILDKYPGSDNPSSFESKVTVKDNNKASFDYKIYMNHVLDHKGYRFFQSAYNIDSNTKKESTVLSVNADYWGTSITYFGYFLLSLSMILTLFWKGSYFSNLRRSLSDIKRKKNTLMLFLLLFTGIAQSQINNSSAQSKKILNKTEGIAKSKIDSATPIDMHGGRVHNKKPLTNEDDIKPRVNTPQAIENPHAKTSFQKGFQQSFQINVQHAKLLARVLVQDQQGRIKPVDTYARELIKTIHGREKIDSFNAVQAYLSLTFETSKWFNKPIILVDKKGGERLKKITHAIEKNGKWYTSAIDLVAKDPKNSENRNLYDIYNESFNKALADQNDFDKAVLKIIQRISIIEGMGKGSYFWIIPDLEAENNDWNSWTNHQNKLYKPGQIYISAYFNSILKARQNGDWSIPNKNLQKIAAFQRTDNIKIPTEKKVNFEIFYNRFPIFKICMAIYSFIGILLLTIAFISLYNNKKYISLIGNILSIIISISFLLHTWGIGARWYISGHAPWSDGYEAIIFVAWFTVFSGIIFARKNYFALSSAAIMSVLLMLFSFLSVVSPAISNLVPVLKSYWLVVHVAVIVSSYGFFGLSFILGIVNLLLMSVRKEKNYKKITFNIKELTTISEMSMTIGLYTLTIGTFLGGVWANESWGRYWSWDPKETWALVSVFIYAAITHLRLVPGFRGYFSFNMTAILGFSSIMMTFLGVNYFLSGMHSYGAGDPIPILEWALPTLFIILLLSILARNRNRRFANKN